MLAILLLAQFVGSTPELTDETVRPWHQAVAEAGSAISALRALQLALTNASRHPRFPVDDIRALDVSVLEFAAQPDDLRWVTEFIRALDLEPAYTGVGYAQVCELLIERYFREGMSSSGEFYTPPAVVRLLVELMPPRPGDRILDPACGSGDLLTAAAKQMGVPVSGASLEAYATDSSNAPLAMMNLGIHGVERPSVRAADPLSLFRDRDNGRVNRVVANPPFGQRIRGLGDAAWPFGEPPSSNANFAWLQFAWRRLNEDGIATMIMPSGAASSEGREAEIRKNMVAGGALLGIVALPPNLFPRTTVDVHLWLLARDKARHLPASEVDQVLFINASRLGTQLPRQSRVLPKEDGERINDRLHAWLKAPRETEDEPGFSCSVTHEQILDNDGNLDPRAYVPVKQTRETAPGVDHLLGQLDQHRAAMSGSAAELHKAVDRYERLIRNGVAPGRVPLRDILAVIDGAADGPGRSGMLAGPSGKHIRNEQYVRDGGVPVVMAQDLTDSGTFRLDKISRISEAHAESLDRFRLRVGDIVMGRRGDLGRCAVTREDQRGWVWGTGCFVLRPPADLDADYLAAYLRSPEARTWLSEHATGSTALKSMSVNVLGGLPVVLPDLGTQRAIAAAVAQRGLHDRLVRAELNLTQQIRVSALAGLLAD